MNINDLIEENKKYNIKKYKDTGESVIYFICENDGKIIYIGTTMYLRNRIKNHSAKICFNGKQFFFFLFPKDKCLELERELIDQIKPQYNILINGNKRAQSNTDSGYKAIRLERSLEIKKEMNRIIKEKNITQSDLADLMKISRQRVHQILKSKKSLHENTIKKFNKAIYVNVSKLVA